MGRLKGGKNRRAFSVTNGTLTVEPEIQASAFPTVEQVVGSPSARIKDDAAKKADILDAAKKIPDIFSPAQVEWVFDAYVAILSFCYSLALKADFTAIQKELEFSKEQKEHLSIPLAKVCSKHAPASWAGMTAEIELIFMMGVWTVSSFKRAQMVAIAEEEKKKIENRTRPLAPMQPANGRQEVHVPA